MNGVLSLSVTMGALSLLGSFYLVRWSIGTKVVSYSSPLVRAITATDRLKTISIPWFVVYVVWWCWGRVGDRPLEK